MYRSQTTYRMGVPPTPPAVKWLIIANIAVFVVHYLVAPFLLQPFGVPPGATAGLIIKFFGFTPALAIGTGFLWQFVTYLFLHGSFRHILLNMFVLWMFGGDLERAWGWREFLKYYFVTGIGAALFQIPVSWGVPSVGASGAIYGLLVAFAVLYPNRMIYLYFFVPIKARWFVIGIIVIELYLGISSPMGGIAHLAHVGGGVIGYLYLKRAWNVSRIVREFRWKRDRRRFRVMEAKDRSWYEPEDPGEDDRFH